MGWPSNWLRALDQWVMAVCLLGCISGAEPLEPFPLSVRLELDRGILEVGTFSKGYALGPGQSRGPRVGLLDQIFPIIDDGSCGFWFRTFYWV